jgi:hypothetical protein
MSALDPQLMNEAIIDRLIRVARAQHRALKALNSSMKTILENPNIDLERYLAVAVTKSNEALKASGEIITEIERILE